MLIVTHEMGFVKEVSSRCMFFLIPLFQKKIHLKNYLRTEESKA